MTRSLLYDAHLHLQDARLDRVRDTVLRELDATGIGGLAVNGTSPDDWFQVAELAERDARIRPQFGLHPWRIAGAPADWRHQLRRLWDTHPRAGVGEFGFDRWMPDPDAEAQHEVFAVHLAVAAAENRCASIHCLRAWGWLLDALRDRPVPARGFLVHAFGGSRETLHALLDRGASVSLSPSFLHPEKRARLELFREVPADRLLIETDAPDMAGPASCRPHALSDPNTGKPLNHPLNLGAVYAEAAAALGRPATALRESCAANFIRLFGAD